jgi:hypothetical protein
MLAGMKLLVAITCSVALLAACSSDSDSTAANTTPSTASTSTASPQSTTTTAAPPTTAAPVTVATVAVTVETTPAATEPEETEPTEPATTDATEPDTAASTSVAATDAPTTSAPAGQYSEVPPPNVPSVSAEVLADNTHPDGVYYATVTEGGDPPPATGEIVFELVQLFRGEKCTEHFGADDEDACVNDYGVDTDPTSTLAVPLKDQYITVADAATQKSLQITGAELYSLIHGDEPSAGAPDGYTYVGFGYFLTISGGKVTRLEQWWTP